jgi:hypothetical protein
MRLLRCSIVLWASLFAVTARVWGARAQEAPTVYIYDSMGTTAKTRTGVWGNGEAARSQVVTYEGSPTLQVTTRNFNEGARFDLGTPLDLKPYKESGLFRLYLRFGSDQPAPAGADTGSSMPPGAGGPPVVAGLPPGWNSAGGPALDMPGGAGGGDPGAAGQPGTTGAQSQKTNITQLQLALVLERGAMFGRVDVPDLSDSTQGQSGPDETGWYLLFLPVREMRATTDAKGLVKRVILTSDKQDTFYVAQIALSNEQERMSVSIRRPQDPLGAQLTEIKVKPGALTLVADVEAGMANPIVEWNFDADNVGNLPPPTLGQPGAPPGDAGMMPGGMDAGAMGGMPVPTGPRIDARGIAAQLNYPNEEQNYRVEVTVRDRSGQKSPVKASLLVQVRA